MWIALIASKKIYVFSHLIRYVEILGICVVRKAIALALDVAAGKNVDGKIDNSFTNAMTTYGTQSRS